jgi:hypothetical protein
VLGGAGSDARLFGGDDKVRDRTLRLSLIFILPTD